MISFWAFQLHSGKDCNQSTHTSPQSAAHAISPSPTAAKHDTGALQISSTHHRNDHSHPMTGYLHSEHFLFWRLSKEHTTEASLTPRCMERKRQELKIEQRATCTTTAVIAPPTVLLGDRCLSYRHYTAAAVTQISLNGHSETLRARSMDRSLANDMKRMKGSRSLVVVHRARSHFAAPRGEGGREIESLVFLRGDA